MKQKSSVPPVKRELPNFQIFQATFVNISFLLDFLGKVEKEIIASK